MNELNKRGHEGVGIDIAKKYSSMAHGSVVTAMTYISLDIANKETIEK